jgi:UDP-glucose 4-epimerase
MLWSPGPAGIPWQEPKWASADLVARAGAFAEAVRSGPRQWVVAWCAGVGVVGTTAEALALETSYLDILLRELGERLSGLPGRVLLASSAGGVYGNNPEQPLTEASGCSPISAYGRNKIAQEQLLKAWAFRQPLASTLIARMSNLYGPGQNLQKPQGLIAHISRSLLHRQPVHLYVPLDTVRDYLYAADCAAQLAVGLERLRTVPGTSVVKIFSAGEPVTIARIIGIFARIAKRQPRIISSADSGRLLQPDRLQFKTAVWRDLAGLARTDLATGIQRVHQYQFGLFQQGQLPPPL